MKESTVCGSIAVFFWPAGCVRTGPCGLAACPGTGAARLTVGTRVLEVKGKAAKVFSLTGPDGKPGVSLLAGDPFRFRLENKTEEENPGPLARTDAALRTGRRADAVPGADQAGRLPRL